MKVKTKTIKNLKNEIIKDGMSTDFTGSVTINWKTKKVLASVLDRVNDGSFEWVNDFDEINFAGIKEANAFGGVSFEGLCADARLTENDGGWRSSDFIGSETSMNKANGWCGREINKLKKLGIISHIRTGDGHWSEARIWFHDDAWKAILEFEDVESEQDVQKKQYEIISNVTDTVLKAAKEIASLGLIKKDSKWDSDLSVKARCLLRDSINDAFNKVEEAKRKAHNKAIKVKELKAQIKSLQA